MFVWIACKMFFKELGRIDGPKEREAGEGLPPVLSATMNQKCCKLFAEQYLEIVPVQFFGSVLVFCFLF